MKIEKKDNDLFNIYNKKNLNSSGVKITPCMKEKNIVLLKS